MRKLRQWREQSTTHLSVLSLTWRSTLLVILGLCLFWVAGLFLAPRTITYDYAQKQTCTTSPHLFPSNAAKVKSVFTFKHTNSVSIGNWKLYAHTLCTTAQHLPAEKTRYTYHNRPIPLLPVSIYTTVAAASYPKLKAPTSTTPRTIALDMPLQIALDKGDATFSYTISNEGKQANCDYASQRLTCDIARLELRYATGYNLTIKRSFHGKSQDSIGSVSVQTITPISIAETSILPGATVQDKPKQLVITTDKPLAKLESATLAAKVADKITAFPVSQRLEGNKVIVMFDQELPRKTTFELTLASLRATDTSGLVGGNYTVSFTTSGGPRATGINIGSRNVSLSPAIAVNFDQPLNANQDPAKFVTFTVNGAPFAASMALAQNRLTIKPMSQLPLCAKISIVITGGFENPAGVGGDSAYSTSARSICYTTFSIGSSVKGRPITAYRFGSGPSLNVYMGAMHGSESNSKRTMDEWFQELNARPERIPAHRSIVIIPSVNPDGVAISSRTNANGVDLNRNFPANDWKSTVTMPGNSQPTGAGGPSPLSEPESRAVASYILNNQPRLVMSFHSKAAVVEANEAGDSVSIASSYAARSRYRAVPKSQSTPIFKYDTTGAMEDWMRDKLGKPAIVVELSTNTSSEFSRNRDALWYTVGL